VILRVAALGLLIGVLLSLLVPLPVHSESLWKDGTSRNMVADKRAAAVGDILSIVVQENSTASKDNSTKTAKSSSADASISSFLYGPANSGLLTRKGQYPALKFSAKSDYEGGGQINNMEKIIARIAVQVIDVLPNGNLVVEGRRTTAFSGETQEAVLRGVVRPADITAANTVFSYHVADASIKFVSKGSVSNVQKKGWFTRFWDKISPF
jgi:flagellar L-ring protein precursor FlgH